MLTFLPQTVHYVLFMDPQIPLFSNFFIKNGSHNTIYTFKNYFTTVISAISFQFQQNKSYPNRPLVLIENHSILNNTINANSIIGKLLSFRLKDTFYIFFSLFIMESCGPYFSRALAISNFYSSNCIKREKLWTLS